MTEQFSDPVIHQAEGVLAERLHIDVRAAALIMRDHSENDGGDLVGLADQIVNHGLRLVARSRLV